MKTLPKLCWTSSPFGVFLLPPILLKSLQKGRMSKTPMKVILLLLRTAALCWCMYIGKHPGAFKSLWCSEINLIAAWSVFKPQKNILPFWGTATKMLLQFSHDSSSLKQKACDFIWGHIGNWGQSKDRENKGKWSPRAFIAIFTEKAKSTDLFSGF